MVFKKLKGYFSLEMSMIMPIILMLFYMFIILAFTLFRNCINDQNSFVNELWQVRATAVYTDGIEVIYREQGVPMETASGGVTCINPLFWKGRY